MRRTSMFWKPFQYGISCLQPFLILFSFIWFLHSKMKIQLTITKHLRSKMFTTIKIKIKNCLSNTYIWPYIDTCLQSMQSHSCTASKTDCHYPHIQWHMKRKWNSKHVDFVFISKLSNPTRIKSYFFTITENPVDQITHISQEKAKSAE